MRPDPQVIKNKYNSTITYRAAEASQNLFLSDKYQRG